MNGDHRTGHRCLDFVLHFHGLQNQDDMPFLHVLPLRDLNGYDLAGNIGRNRPGFLLLAASGATGFCCRFDIRNFNFERLTVHSCFPYGAVRLKFDIVFRSIDFDLLRIRH